MLNRRELFAAIPAIAALAAIFPAKGVAAKCDADWVEQARYPIKNRRLVFRRRVRLHRESALENCTIEASHTIVVDGGRLNWCRVNSSSGDYVVSTTAADTGSIIRNCHFQANSPGKQTKGVNY